MTSLFRELLCAGINELVVHDHIKLEGTERTSGQYQCTLFGQESIIKWRGIGYDEIEIVVWWSIKPDLKDSIATKPLNKQLSKALDACCTGWLERKKGKWLQGCGSDGFLNTYCSKSGRQQLKAMPAVSCLGFEKEGKLVI